MNRAIIKLSSRLTRRLIPGTSLCLAFTALMSLLTPASNMKAQEIGKLFSTPEEREYLDYLRTEFMLNSQETGFNIDRTITPEIPVIEEEIVEPEPDIVEFSLGGIMNRRDGSKTVWLNNQPVNESDLPENISLQTQNGALALRIESDNTIFTLRPGQRVNLSTGIVSESFQARNASEASPPPSRTIDVDQEADIETVNQTSDQTSVTELTESLQQVQESLGAGSGQ